MDAPRATPIRPPGRPARIGRDQILDAAAEIGFEALTMQAVAERLGVSSQALYRWVADREELLDLLADRIVERAMPEPARDGDWRGWLAAFARANRTTLLTMDGSAVRGLTRYHVSPAFVRLQERALQALTAGGMEPQLAVHAWAIYGSSLLGWIAREQSLAVQQREGRSIAEEVRHLRGELDEPVPLVAAHFDRFAATPADERFELFLTALLDGIAALARA